MSVNKRIKFNSLWQMMILCVYSLCAIRCEFQVLDYRIILTAKIEKSFCLFGSMIKITYICNC